jgi:hypothetical protein
MAHWNSQVPTSGDFFRDSTVRRRSPRPMIRTIRLHHPKHAEQRGFAHVVEGGSLRSRLEIVAQADVAAEGTHAAPVDERRAPSDRTVRTLPALVEDAAARHPVGVVRGIRDPSKHVFDGGPGLTEVISIGLYSTRPVVSSTGHRGRVARLPAGPMASVAKTAGGSASPRAYASTVVTHLARSDNLVPVTGVGLYESSLAKRISSV